ncbi:MAG: hypothetical protein Q4D04_02075 [Clostridia bacterium]|nr:hypothetical protein [Clostridia bacterium]
MLIFIGLVSLKFPIADYGPESSVSQWAASSFGKWALEGKPMLFLLAQSIVRALGAAMWATSALAISPFLRSRFLIVLAPTVFYYLWEYLDAYYVIWTGSKYPGIRYIELGITNYIEPMQAFIKTICVLIPFTLFWSIVYFIVASRRLRNG